MTEDLQLQPITIQNKIYEIRNQKVMLDFDLAELYGVETKRLKEAVRRNITRFPSDFMFELEIIEWKNLRTQIASSSWGGVRYKPFAFTEQGVVMLDFDLAAIYKVETRVLNQSVKRNIERFPEDFMFQLTESEWKMMSSQIVMTSKSKRPNTALPYAFTEHGVTMLSSILKSTIAIQINIQLVRAFIAIRQVVLKNPDDKIITLQAEMKEFKTYIEEVFSDYNDINEDTRMQIELINQSLAELQNEKKQLTKPRNKVGFI